MTLQLKPLHKHFVAEASGIDLTQPLSVADTKVPGYSYPTVSEVLPGFSVNALLGFVAPAGTPRAIVQKIQADTAKVLANPETKKRIEELGMEIATPAEARAMLSLKGGDAVGF